MVKCSSCGFEINNDSALYCPGCGQKTDVMPEARFPHDMSKIWPEWKLVEQIGKGAYGIVYKAERIDDFVKENKAAAIKVISIPQDSSEVDSLRSEGLDEEKSRTYFKNIVDDFVGEIEVMESLKGMQNIVSVEDYKVVEKKDEIGWNIYIRMELLTPLKKHFLVNNFTEADIISLGSDICTALEYCSKINVVHRDIKPENIFVNDFGDFKLGDFGIAKKLKNHTGSFSQKGTYGYMAPEVFYSRPYDARADIYSLGVVLYYFLNKKRLPFTDINKQVITSDDKMRAVERRLNGETLPVPKDASADMADLILCACRYNPDGRFNSASIMKKALESVRQNNYDNYIGQVGMNKNFNGAAETINGNDEMFRAGNYAVHANNIPGGNMNADINGNNGNGNYNGGNMQPSDNTVKGTGKILKMLAIAALIALIVTSGVAGGIAVSKNLIDKNGDASSDAHNTVTEESATMQEDIYAQPNNYNNNGYVPGNGNAPVNPPNVMTGTYVPEPNEPIVETTIIIEEPDNNSGVRPPVTSTTRNNAVTTKPATTPTSAPATTRPPETTAGSEMRMPSTKSEIIDFYSDAVNNVKSYGAGFTVSEWQETASVNLGGGVVNTAARTVIDSFISTEDDAKTETYSKGSNNARNAFPGWYLSDNSYVKSASCTRNGNNYRVVIVMQDEDTPTQASSTLAQVSGMIYYWEDVDNILSSYPVVTKVLSDYGDIHMYYRNYTITADVTPDGELISIVHSADLEVYIGYATVVGMSLSDKNAHLWVTEEYYNFNY